MASAWLANVCHGMCFDLHGERDRIHDESSVVFMPSFAFLTLCLLDIGRLTPTHLTLSSACHVIHSAGHRVQHVQPVGQRVSFSHVHAACSSPDFLACLHRMWPTTLSRVVNICPTLGSRLGHSQPVITSSRENEIVGGGDGYAHPSLVLSPFLLIAHWKAHLNAFCTSFWQCHDTFSLYFSLFTPHPLATRWPQSMVVASVNDWVLATHFSSSYSKHISQHYPHIELSSFSTDSPIEVYMLTQARAQFIVSYTPAHSIARPFIHPTQTQQGATDAEVLPVEPATDDLREDGAGPHGLQVHVRCWHWCRSVCHRRHWLPGFQEGVCVRTLPVVPTR